MRLLNTLNPPEQDDYDIYEFPTLPEWFSSIDNDPERNVYGDTFSEFSGAFELHGLTALSHLEGLKLGQLFEHFGMPEEEALRLLDFAEEDIQLIRRINNPRVRT